ncbi:MAG: GNAT family N-acetyltransferase [Actinobacteria bacterium]|nr:GNAT family N-acetyltransferase [Actinomycetota bacterium]
MSTPPPLPVRPLADGEAATFMQTAARGFGHTIDDATVAELVAIELGETSRAFVSHDADHIVGTALALDWALAIPYGSSARCAGVTSVTVAPTHRRRGVLRSLMRHQLDDLHDGGVAWAALYSSESAIYGRFGYGVAARSVSARIDRPWTAFTTPVAPAAVELVSAEAAVERVAAIYHAVQAQVPGMMAVPPRYTEHRVAWDPPGERGGASEQFVAIIDDRAYAMYRLANDWDEAGSKARLTVRECLATDAEAHRQMWTYLFGIDLIQHVRVDRLAIDDPLPWWLAERQRLRLTASMTLYVRLVDVGTALSQRGTRGRGAVVVDVADAFCPWNERRWQLDGDGRQLRCTTTDAPPDVWLDVRELASLSLGGVAPGELARAGLLGEHTPGSAAQLTALLAADRQPFNPFTF